MSDYDWFDTLPDDAQASVKEMTEIVNELAERGPFGEVNNDDQRRQTLDCWTCALAVGVGEHRGSLTEISDPLRHDPSCLWRRAKALYP